MHLLRHQKDDWGITMWDVVLPVLGSCPDCGEDVSRDVRLWATTSWMARYQSEDRLRRGIDRAIERIVVERHAHVCAGQKRERTVYAVSA